MSGAPETLRLAERRINAGASGGRRMSGAPETLRLAERRITQAQVVEGDG